MNILHITAHMGGGIGTVIMGWVDNDKENNHAVMLLDYANEKAIKWANDNQYDMSWNELNKDFQLMPFYIPQKFIQEADIVICHIYENPLMNEFLSRPLPDCRLVFWCHKNYNVPATWMQYPDRFFDTSPIQRHGAYIWSTGGVEKFLKLEKKEHEGFNVGYVGEVSYQGKMHPEIFDICNKIREAIPTARFTFVGENKTAMTGGGLFTFTGKIDDVAPYLAEMDVFLCPLRQDHYGTAEQALGEAMAARVVPVVLDNPAERLIVDHARNGYVAKDGKECVGWVKYLHDNPDHRRHLANIASHDARYLYDIEDMIGQWNKVFADMMKEGKRERGAL